MKRSTLFYKLVGYITLLHNKIKKMIRARQRRLDFIGIGVAKAGTTALYSYLNEHPEIGMGSKKEIHFFDMPENFFFPNWFYFRYHKYFNFKSGKKIYGEITPIYIYWRNAAANIYEYNPNIKIIAILRNPVDRAFSHWNMNIKMRYDTLPFKDSIEQENSRAKRRLPYQHHNFSQLDRGFYAAQIREYRRFFPNNQLLFIKYEEFKAKPQESMDTIFQFLSVNPSLFEFKPNKANVFEYENKIDESFRRSLIDTYRYDILEVERLLGWDCSDWLQ